MPSSLLTFPLCENFLGGVDVFLVDKNSNISNCSDFADGALQHIANNLCFDTGVLELM